MCSQFQFQHHTCKTFQECLWLCAFHVEMTSTHNRNLSVLRVATWPENNNNNMLCAHTRTHARTHHTFTTMTNTNEAHSCAAGWLTPKPHNSRPGSGDIVHTVWRAWLERSLHNFIKTATSSKALELPDGSRGSKGSENNKNNQWDELFSSDFA